MKKIFFISLLVSLAMIQTLAAEPASGAIDDAGRYFSKASILDSTLILVGKPEFALAGVSKKKEIVSKMLVFSKTTRAVVDSDGQSYLWYKLDDVMYCKEWNTERNLIEDYNYAKVDRLGEDKWFFTVGGEFSVSSAVSVGVNGRVGTYLWKRFLDAGLGFNVGYSNSGDYNGWDVSANISSRLYFTRFFSKYSLSPFVGVGLGFVFCPSTDFDPLGTIGFNWYLPKGSIDFALQYGKASKFGITAGYTISF